MKRPRLNECPNFNRDQERELAVRARAGCQVSRNALIESQIPFAILLARRYQAILGDFDETFSLAQETLMHCVRRLDPDRGRLTTLVGVSVFQACVRAAKRQTQIKSVSDERLHDGADERQTDPLEKVILKEAVGTLKKKLRKLSKREALILRLHYRQGLNFQQIGDELQLSRERVRQLHLGAILKLRHALREHGS